MKIMRLLAVFLSWIFPEKTVLSQAVQQMRSPHDLKIANSGQEPPFVFHVLQTCACGKYRVLNLNRLYSGAEDNNRNKIRGAQRRRAWGEREETREGRGGEGQWERAWEFTVASVWVRRDSVWEYMHTSAFLHQCTTLQSSLLNHKQGIPLGHFSSSSDSDYWWRHII